MPSILLTITLLLGGAISCPDDYVSLRQAGLDEYEVGHYAKAEELLRKGLNGVGTINNEYEVALSYSALGEIQQAHGQLADAERHYRKAISLLIHHRERSHTLARAWRNLGLGALLAAMGHREKFLVYSGTP